MTILRDRTHFVLRAPESCVSTQIVQSGACTPGNKATEACFVAVFLIEMTLRAWYRGFKTTITDVWNYFDGIIIGVSVFDLAVAVCARQMRATYSASFEELEEGHENSKVYDTFFLYHVVISQKLVRFMV